MLLIFRFFREHLKPFIPIIALGSILLMLAAIFQGFQIGLLKLLFDAKNSTNLISISNISNLDFISRIQLYTAYYISLVYHLRTYIYPIPLILLFVFIFKGIVTYIGSMLITYSGIKATISLREHLFSHLLKQELAYFQKHSAGELLQKFISDINIVQGVTSLHLADAIRDIAILIAMVFTVMIMNWRLSIVLFAVGPLMTILIKRLNQRLRSINHCNMEASSVLLQRLKEVLSNIRVVLGFAGEIFEKKLFHKRNEELLQILMKSARNKAMTHPIMESFGGFLLASLLIYAFTLNGGNAIDPGFIAYIVAIQAIYDPLRRLTRLNNELQVARVSLERIYNVIDRQSMIITVPYPTPVPLQPQQLAFKEVCFSYATESNKRNKVLNNISLTICKGETVALVGTSGGGKTTLLNLVPRFFDPTSGCVTIDGIDLRNFDPRELRLRIGIVTQETLLFMDSIHDNIAYSKTISREKVIEAAKMAQAHDFIMSLPKQYDTTLAEAGSTLSGGQRQRLAIARALLHDPPILLLDEATSALDAENERAVQEALQALIQDRTTLMIAHRLSTIQRATRICVLNHGKIVETGDHEQLLETKGDYSRLYNLQLQHY